MDQEDSKDIDFNEQCVNSIFCKNVQCQQKHPRKLQGVCISHQRQLQKEDEAQEQSEYVLSTCGNKECKLNHIQRDALFQQFQESSTVNGYYYFNLCKFQCFEKGCLCVHQCCLTYYCISNFFKQCGKNAPCRQNKIHQNWKEFQQKFRDRYQIDNVYPENLEQKIQESSFLKDICQKNLCGECDYVEEQCNFKHYDWEKVYKTIKTPFQCCTINNERSIIKTIHRNNLLIDTNKRAKLICEKKRFENFKNQLKDSIIIDVIFIMDLTGSMSKWQQQMIDNIEKVINEFEKTVSNHIVKIGFIGYRDDCDTDKIVSRNLTNNCKEIVKFIKNQKAEGGGDEAEDVVNGLEQILNLNISKQSESMLCMFLIADSPCHGHRYHNMNPKRDKQYDTIEGTPLEDVVKKIKQLKEKLFFFCFKINETTDKMYNIMQEIMKEQLVITDVIAPEQLADTVGFTLQTSYQKSLYTELKQDKMWVEANYEKPEFGSQIIQDNFYDSKQQYWYEYQKTSKKRSGETALEIELEDIKDLQISDSLNSASIKSKATIKSLVSKKTGQACKTLIFKAFDAINNQQVVLKISQNYLTQMEKCEKEEEQQKIIGEAEEQAEIRYFSSLYACQMARIYRNKTKQLPEKEQLPPIFYAVPILYILKEPFWGLKKVYAESFIQNKFLKYTTNQKSLNPIHYFYTVFSHFSYEESQNFLIVTDLQGSYSIFSDPAIQIDPDIINKFQKPKDSSSLLIQKDKTNLKKKGFEYFRKSHNQCSHLCKFLGLQPLDSSQNSTQNFPFLKPNQETLQIICDSCNEFSDISYVDYYSQIKMTQCQNCREIKEEVVDCKCCKLKFQCKVNIRLVVNKEIYLCDDCLLCNTSDPKFCYYCNSQCERFSKLREVQFSNEKIWLCQDSLDYFTFLRCEKCDKKFDFGKILTKQECNESYYVCCK